MSDNAVQTYDTPDYSGKLRDLEEKQRLLKDRVLLIGQSLIEERNKNLSDIQELKKSIIRMKDDVDRIKEMLERVTEQLSNVVRKEELTMIQRQLDLLRK